MRTKALGALLLVLLILCGVPGTISADEYLRATLVDHKGVSVKVSRILARGTIEGRMGGAVHEYRFSDLSRIENLGNEIFRVTTRQGQTRTLERVSLRTPGQTNRVVYWTFDKSSGVEKRFSLGLMGFHTLNFSGEAGRLKYNPDSGTYFPPDYIFDPFTGRQLVWKSPPS
ncbi:hypothetical protein [Trichloromonas sp.]|uniref:hypothetical protein n=1 Tax=Trichloromonas sp. TaxID=3069249 RepID=UPI003D819CA8